MRGRREANPFPFFSACSAYSAVQFSCGKSSQLASNLDYCSAENEMRPSVSPLLYPKLFAGCGDRGKKYLTAAYAEYTESRLHPAFLSAYFAYSAVALCGSRLRLGCFAFFASLRLIFEAKN